MNRDNILKLMYDRFETHDLSKVASHRLVKYVTEEKIGEIVLVQILREKYHLYPIKNDTELLYLFISNIDKPLCSYCKTNFVEFVSFNKGYRSYCCNKCVTSDPDFWQKVRSVCMKRYGGPAPSSSPEVVEKMQATRKKKYGEGFRPITEKSKRTCLERYGLEWSGQVEEFKNKAQEIKRRKFFIRLLESDRLKEKCEPLFTLDDYNGADKDYKWKCKICNTIYEDNLDDGHIPRCPICYPKQPKYSMGEKEIVEICKQYFPNLIENDRTILGNRQEIDILIPEKNLGIEYNGLYWHSENMGGGKNYHQQKTLLAAEKGIQLIHIFEDEWRYKQDIVTSILLSKFGRYLEKIYARKCKLSEVRNNEAIIFLDDNHIQGHISGKHLGLFYDDNLVSILTTGKSRFNKSYEFEILRFCSKRNIQILGGLSKMMSHFILMNKPESIITYIDARFGIGKSYKNCKFEYKGMTRPGYYYIEDNGRRSTRFQYQKHKLSKILRIFDPNLTEWENMQLNGYDRIWDCGNYIYDWHRR